MNLNRDSVREECCRLATQYFYLPPNTTQWAYVTDMAAFGPLPKRALYQFLIKIEDMSCYVTRTAMTYKIDPDTSNTPGQEKLAMREQVLERALTHWFGKDAILHKDDHILDAALAAKLDAPTAPIIEDIPTGCATR